MKTKGQKNEEFHKFISELVKMQENHEFDMLLQTRESMTSQGGKIRNIRINKGRAAEHEYFIEYSEENDQYQYIIFDEKSETHTYINLNNYKDALMFIKHI